MQRSAQRALEHTVARAFRAPATAIEIVRIQAIAHRARRGALDVRCVATLRTALRSFTPLQEQAILSPENPSDQVEDDMANRQQRSNREKKKPKADKNKKKDKAPTSPFASALNPASVAPGSIGKKA